MKSIWLIFVMVLLAGTSEAVLTSNRWQTGNGKWETPANWTQGAPSPTQAICIIASIFPSVTEIDTGTVTQHVINSCMTISNLVVGGFTTHALSLTNANDTPGNIGLIILNSLTITSSGSMTITNSRLRVGLPGGEFLNNGNVIMNGGSVLFSNVSTRIGDGGVGALTIRGGTWSSIGLGGTEIGGFVNQGVGTLTISGGAATFSFGGLDLGRERPGSTGVVWMTGGQLTVDQLIPGYGNGGVGQMTISNGTCFGQTIRVGLFFGSQGTFTVAGGTNLFTEYLTVGELAGATGTVWATGGQFTITNNVIAVGVEGTGQMTISNGTWLANALYVGEFPGGRGTFNFAGGSLAFQTSTALFFPNFFIVGSMTNSTGTVWMTGGSLTTSNLTTTIASNGVGQMTMSNGTWLANSVFVGRNAGSQGTLTIAGGTNRFFFGDFVVGSAAGATGTVWMTGGQLESTTGIDPLVVVADSGVGRMTVSNGTWLSKFVLVGSTGGGSGTLTIAGGTNDFGVLNTALSLGATGVVWLTGGQLLTTNFGATIGFAGSGRLTVSNGNWQGHNVVAGLLAGSRGTITAAGGISTINSNLVLGDCASDAFGLLIVNGGHVFVTNATANAVLDVRNGWVLLTTGQLKVDKLVITNACGYFFHGGGSLSVGNLLLSVNDDADADGLPNGWELTYGLDPLESAGDDGYLGDPDGDGMNNYAEYLAGTDPTDPNSTPFRITAIERQGNNMLITWTTTGSKTNRVQATAGLAGGSYSNNFTDLSPIIIPTGNSLTSTNYLDPGAATNFPSRYYRVRLAP